MADLASLRPPGADVTEWNVYARCVERGTHSERTGTAACVECGFARSDFPDQTTIQRMRLDDVIMKGLPAAMAGDAADRERYVTERAKVLAQAFIVSTRAHAGAEGLPSLWEVSAATAAFRDLVDKGVLK